MTKKVRRKHMVVVIEMRLVIKSIRIVVIRRSLVRRSQERRTLLSWTMMTTKMMPLSQLMANLIRFIHLIMSR